MTEVLYQLSLWFGWWGLAPCESNRYFQADFYKYCIFRVIASILILKSLTSMVQKLKSISSFDPPMENEGEEVDELESVECFSVDSLDQERKVERQSNVKNGYKQNGYKL